MKSLTLVLSSPYLQLVYYVVGPTRLGPKTCVRIDWDQVFFFLDWLEIRKIPSQAQKKKKKIPKFCLKGEESLSWNMKNSWPGSKNPETLPFFSKILCRLSKNLKSLRYSEANNGNAVICLKWNWPSSRYLHWNNKQ